MIRQVGHAAAIALGFALAALGLVVVLMGLARGYVTFIR